MASSGPRVGERGIGNSVELDEATNGMFEEGVPTVPGEHPLARGFKRGFMCQRISEGMEPARAVVATRRRFSTPDEPEARRRILAARESLSEAGVFGVAIVTGSWTVDKPEVYAFTNLPHDEALDLVEDALDGFIEFGGMNVPSKALDWWYLETPDAIIRRQHERMMASDPGYAEDDRQSDEGVDAFKENDPDGFSRIEAFLVHVRTLEPIGQWEWMLALNHLRASGMPPAEAVDEVRRNLGGDNVEPTPSP